MSKPSGALLRIFPNRGWSAIPEPEEDLVSMDKTVRAMKERTLVQSREAGDVRESFATVSDLIAIGSIDASGKTLEARVKDIEDRLAAAGIP